MPKLSSAIVIGILLCTGIFVTPAAASGELSVSDIPSEYIVGDPSNPGKTLKLEVFVSSKMDQKVVVELIDFYSDETGIRTQLPAGSTPYSLANVIEVVPFENSYRGNGKQQRYEIELRPKSKYEQSLFTGGVTVKLEPLGDSGAGVGTSGSIVRFLTVTPYGLAASLAESDLLPARIVRHDLKPLSRSSFIDSVLPDIPGIVNFGAVESRVTYENVGQFPVFAGLSWEFASGGTVIASKSFRPALLAPEKQVSKTVSTEITGTNELSKLNILPSFGFVSNKISLTSSLGGTQLPVQSYDGSFLVLQWKEPFVALLGIYFLVRWAWRRNLSESKKQESASLLWLGIRDAFRRIRARTASPKILASQETTRESQASFPKQQYVYPNRYDIKPARPSLLGPTTKSDPNQFLP